MNPQKKSPDSGFQYFDLATGYLGKAREFYGGLLSWDFRELIPEAPEAGVFFRAGAGLGGGKYLEAAPGEPGGWTPYFQVQNLESSLARALRLGGEIVMPPTATPGELGGSFVLSGIPVAQRLDCGRPGPGVKPGCGQLTSKQQETTHGTAT